MCPSGAVCSYVYLFEIRSSSLPQNRFKITRKSTRLLYHAIVFFYNCSCLLFFLTNPADQEAAKLHALTRYPCPTTEFFEFPVTILLTDQNVIQFISFIFLPSMILQTAGNIIFHAFCAVYYLYIAPSKSVSKETQKNQKAFLIGILLQTCIPLMFISGPLIILAIAYSFGYYSQEMMNLSIVCAAFHGVAQSVAVITVHHHYRKTAKKMIWKIICKGE